MILPPLWPHQARAVAGAKKAYLDGSRAICIAAPTGAGKTRIGVEVAIGAARKGGKVLWIAHRRELVEQARSRLPNEIYVTTIQSLLASGERPPATVLVADECHHLPSGGSWQTVAGDYIGALIIGLTATPERSDGRPLGDVFSSLVVAASYSELTDSGRLVPCTVYAPEKRKGLAMTPGDAHRMYCRDLPTIIFYDLVKSAHAGAEDIGGEVITGETPTFERDLALSRFLAGEVSVLHNVYCLTEGTDLPLTQGIILARGASHASTLIQMAGRGLRASPGKTECTIVDLVGSVHDHGLPNEDREYSLEGKAIRRKKADPIWSCKDCGWCLPYAPPGRLCPGCGSMMPEPEAIKVARRRVERIGRLKRHTPEERKEAWEFLKVEAKRRGHKIGWAQHRYHGRYGEWPRW